MLNNYLQDIHRLKFELKLNNKIMQVNCEWCV